MKIKSIIQYIFKLYKKKNNKLSYKPVYRVVEILKDENQEHTALIQFINSRSTFYAKPEEILADDKLVNMFSPLDVRTLTYLGYIGINTPKYKILAQRFMDEGKLIFIIAQKGTNEIILKTPSEIMYDSNFIQNLNSSDASTVSYVIGMETFEEYNKQKKSSLKK